MLCFHLDSCINNHSFSYYSLVFEIVVWSRTFFDAPWCIHVHSLLFNSQQAHAWEWNVCVSPLSILCRRTKILPTNIDEPMVRLHSMPKCAFKCCSFCAGDVHERWASSVNFSLVHLLLLAGWLCLFMSDGCFVGQSGVHVSTPVPFFAVPLLRKATCFINAIFYTEHRCYCLKGGATLLFQTVFSHKIKKVVSPTWEHLVWEHLVQLWFCSVLSFFSKVFALSSRDSCLRGEGG